MSTLSLLCLVASALDLGPGAAVNAESVAHTYSWGDGTNGNLGCGPAGPTCQEESVPQAVVQPEGVIFTKLASGSAHNAAVGSDGYVYAWGNNSSAQVTGVAGPLVLQPTRVNTPQGVRFVDVSTGSTNTMALDDTGRVWSWGGNGWGEQACPSGCIAPHPIAGLSDIVGIAAGGTTAFAWDGAGTAWAWGRNDSGMLGTGSTAGVLVTPRPVLGGARYRQISAARMGGFRFFAVGLDSSVWAWGCPTSQVTPCNTTTILATPTLLSDVFAAVSQATPIMSTSVPPALAISVGSSHDLLLSTSGEIWEMGLATTSSRQFMGSEGEINGAPYSALVRVHSPAGVTFSAIATGENHSLAIASDGQLYAWGNNVSHQVNLPGATVGRPTPVPGFVNVVAISGGRLHSVATVNDDPANTPPTVSIDDVTDGATYVKGSVPIANCHATDTEDGPSAFDAALSEVTGPHASDGIGTRTATCTHTDSGGLPAPTVSATYSIHDSTPPEITSQVTGTLGENGWYTSDVSLSWTVHEPESPNSVATSGCVEQSITGDQTSNSYPCDVTSAGGTAAPVEVSIQRDAENPDVTVTGATDGTSYTIGSVPAPACDTTDATSGVATPAIHSASGGPLGPVTVTCSGAVDNAGNVNDATITYAVVYDWNGFFQPIDNDVTNEVKAGRAIPVKFELEGDQGPDIFTSGTPTSREHDCSTSNQIDPIEETLTAGGSSLIYDAATGQYTYVWKTDKAWADQCRTLTLTLIDGTTHAADFSFTK